MKKQILNIGKALSRVEQKQVFGGYSDDSDAGEGDGACLSAGNYCRSDANQKCCGSCHIGSGRNGICR